MPRPGEKPRQGRPTGFCLPASRPCSRSKAVIARLALSSMTMLAISRITQRTTANQRQTAAPPDSTRGTIWNIRLNAVIAIATIG